MWTTDIVLMQLVENHMQSEFGQSPTFYLNRESGKIAFSGSTENSYSSDSEYIRVDGHNSENILKESYILRADLDSQADTGLVHSFPPQYWPDESPPLDDYVQLGAVEHHHDILAATIEPHPPNELVITIPGETTRQTGSDPPRRRIMRYNQCATLSR
jgi:hypothetical protein